MEISSVKISRMTIPEIASEIYKVFFFSKMLNA